MTVLSVAHSHTGLCVDHTASIYNQPDNVNSATLPSRGCLQTTLNPSYSLVSQLIGINQQGS